LTALKGFGFSFLCEFCYKSGTFLERIQPEIYQHSNTG